MSAPAFELPRALEATEPPEARGLARDDVRLMVARRGDGQLDHLRFHQLAGALAPGDLLVLNVSATLPAALATAGGVRVHFSTGAPGLDESWRVIELRSGDGAAPVRGRAGQALSLHGGGSLQLVAPYASGARLWLARLEAEVPVEEYLARHGEPIRYGYVPEPRPLSDYQTVYAANPGSSEMPSAGRPFSSELLTRLISSGVLIATVTLHCGVSSPEHHEPPFPEYYVVPPSTAGLVGAVRRAGGRVIAVGTTVVRALETAAAPGGSVASGSGWTGLVIGPERGLRVVDGLITGWHEPEASHLQLLSAVAGPELLERCYAAALQGGYLWHEFGDSHLILP